MEQLNTLIQKALRRQGLHPAAQAALVVYRAQKWLGENLPDFKDEIKAKRFDGENLHIECNHSVAAQECHQKQAELLDYLKESGVEVSGVIIKRS